MSARTDPSDSGAQVAMSETPSSASVSNAATVVAANTAADIARGAVWRRALLTLALVLIWLGFWYRQTGLSMVGIWIRSETFTHCFLIPPISLWLAWRMRPELARMTPAPNGWFMLPIAAAGLVWLAGQLAAVNALTHLSLVALVVLTVPAILGARVAWALAFPLGFLFFAAPVGEFVMPQMMEWTADFAVLAVRLSGVPVFRDGLQFVIPSGNWSVVEACSGVRYLIASVTVGTLFAYLNYTSFKRRLVFVGISILVPVVANWLRAYMIVMLGHLSGNKIAVGVDHLIYGWVFFGVVIMVMFAIGARWREDLPAEAGGAIAPEPASASGARLSGATAWFATIATMVFFALPIVAERAILRTETAAPTRISAPVIDSPWRPVAGPLSEWRPAFDGAAAELLTAYTRDAKSVGLFVALYRNQDFEHKLVSSENVLVRSDDTRWAQIGSDFQEAKLGDESVRFRRARLRGAQLGRSDGRWLVWQVYWIDGHLTASDYLAKAYIAWSRIRGRGDDAAVIILYTPIEPPETGVQALTDFARLAGPAIDTMLRRAGESR